MVDKSFVLLARPRVPYERYEVVAPQRRHTPQTRSRLAVFVSFKSVFVNFINALLLHCVIVHHAAVGLPLVVLPYVPAIREQPSARIFVCGSKS